MPPPSIPQPSIPPQRAPRTRYTCRWCCRSSRNRTAGSGPAGGGGGDGGGRGGGGSGGRATGGFATTRGFDRFAEVAVEARGHGLVAVFGAGKAAIAAAEKDLVSKKDNARWLAAKWVYEFALTPTASTPTRNAACTAATFPRGGMWSEKSDFCQGFGICPAEYVPALKWVYDHQVEPGNGQDLRHSRLPTPGGLRPGQLAAGRGRE